MKTSKNNACKKIIEKTKELKKFVHDIHTEYNKNSVDNWQETGKLIEKYNIMLTPCLAIKEERKKDWWSAGKMSLGVAKNTNHVQYEHLAWGCTPHEAVKNAVEKFKKQGGKRYVRRPFR